MKIFFSWLKKSAANLDFLSSFAATCACILLLGGIVSVTTDFRRADKIEAEQASDVQSGRIVLKFADFHPEPDAKALTEIAPDEEMPPPTLNPEPKKENPLPPPEKIDDSALKEVAETEPPPKSEAHLKKIQEAETPKAAPEPERPLPVPASKSPPPSTTSDNSVQLEAARRAAEQTLYGALADAVRREKFYPRSARRSGYAGTVSLRVEISESGKITAFEIASSEAHRLLQSGAMKTLRRVAENFSAPPGTHSVLPAIFIVPIVYELN